MSEQSINNRLPSDFVERAREARERLRREGIILWRPRVDDDDILKMFDVSIVDRSVGCTDETCEHNNHDPASPSLIIMPKEGRLLYLGVLNYGAIRRTYYVLLRSDAPTLYYEVVEEPNYYTKIFPVSPAAVPDFMLVSFAD